MPIENIINYNPEEIEKITNERAKALKLGVAWRTVLFFAGILVFVLAVLKQNTVSSTAALVCIISSIISLHFQLKILFKTFKTCKVRYYLAVRNKQSVFVSLMKIEGNVGEVSIVACGEDQVPVTTTIPFNVEYSSDIETVTLDIESETVFVPVTEKIKIM